MREINLQNLKFKFPLMFEEWMQKDFYVENYHKHTMWSNLRQIDCATSINEFICKMKERHGTLYFSGEHGYQGEFLKCYDICQNIEDVNVRYSTEAYWVKDRHEQDRTNCHIMLIARNETGMRKVNYILSMANIDGFYYQPRIDLELLFTLTPEDVYVTSACVAGWKYEDATEIWLRIAEHFRDSFFLEYQCHNTDSQKELNKKIQAIAKNCNIQTIVGLDTHAIDEQDLIRRDKVLERKGIRYEDEEGWYLDYPTGTEIIRRFREQGVLNDDEILTSMANTHIFVNGCEEIHMDTDFKIPIAKQYADKNDSERIKALKYLLNDKYKKEPSKSSERIEGLRYEMGEIVDSGMYDYFLSNYEIISRAVTPEYGGQLTATSRGSAASYYTSKLLGFTTMDRFEAEVPILPERFITKDRIIGSHQCPDIDFNCAEQPPFVKASRDVLGEECCYPLLAVGKFGEKSGWKMYAGVNNIPMDVSNGVSKFIDAYNEAVKQADEGEEISIEDYIKDKELLELYYQSRDYQNIVEGGRPHACGHLIFNGDHKNKDIIGYGDIRYEIGLFRVTSKSGKNNPVLVACVEGDLLDKYGYVKNDYLIVDTVSLIYKLYHKIGMEVPTVSQMREMVNGDKATWNLYSIGATCSLNQCERGGTTLKAKQYRPQTVQELAAFVAAIRPGFKSLVNGFLRRDPYTNGEREIDKILTSSFHYMLYQEAIMQIFNKVLGIDMRTAYDTIKAISKKKLRGEKLAELEQTMREAWLKNIGNMKNFDKVYQVIKDSARYSFNAPHALAVAYDSLYEAWVKAHYPSVFYEVAMNHYQAKDKKDKVAALQKEAVELMGYTVGQYRYGLDNSKITVDDSTRTIYPDLSSIKGIGKGVINELNRVHQKGYKNFCDIYRYTKIKKDVFRKLVLIEYFKDFGTIRTLMEQMDICDFWQDRKTWSKNKECTWNIDFAKYGNDKIKSGVGKQWKDLNTDRLIRDLCSDVSLPDTPLAQKVRYDLDILGYSERSDVNVDRRVVVIHQIDTQYSPKFIAYNINTGKSQTFKTYKKSYNAEPFEENDILVLTKFKKKQKSQKVGEKWIPVPGSYEWWAESYYKISMRDVGEKFTKKFFSQG